MFNRGKLYSGIAAVSIYLLLIFIVLYYYNVHAQKAKNYVEKNSNRVTVTLVNSDKTVFNRSDEVNKPKKPLEEKKVPTTPPTPQKMPEKEPEVKKEPEAKKEPEIQKEPEPKKEVKTPTLAEEQQRKEQQRREAAQQERERQAQIAKEAERKKVLEAKKIAEAKRQAQLEAEKKKQQEEAKRREAERQKEVERKRLAEQEDQKRREEAERKKNQQRPKDIFANVNANEPVKQTTQPRSEPSQIKHTSSAADRIRNTQLSGQQSDQNRERGIEDAYLAKVKNQLNNWSAQSNYKGHTATIRLTISNSGHFSYSIQSSTSGEMSAGLREFLDQLNRIGLGSHSKSSPYVISVNFIAR